MATRYTDHYSLTQTKEVPPPAFVVLNEINIISQLSTNALARALPHGLSTAQFTVLTHLARLGGEWSPLRLARAFQVTKGAMTNTLSKLAARGFITIAPDPADGRAKIITLSEAGAKAFEEAVIATTPLTTELTTHFTEENLAKALPFLTELRQYLDKMRP